MGHTLSYKRKFTFIVTPEKKRSDPREKTGSLRFYFYICKGRKIVLFLINYADWFLLLTGIVYKHHDCLFHIIRKIIQIDRLLF